MFPFGLVDVIVSDIMAYLNLSTTIKDLKLKYYLIVRINYC